MKKKVFFKAISDLYKRYGIPCLKALGTGCLTEIGKEIARYIISFLK